MCALKAWLVTSCTAIVALSKLPKKLFLNGYSASALPIALNGAGVRRA